MACHALRHSTVNAVQGNFLQSMPILRGPWQMPLGRGRAAYADPFERQRAESQWIVAVRPLCHIQYPVAYLSRLQRILPAAPWKLYFKAVTATLMLRQLSQRHVPLGAIGSYCGSASGRREHASLLVRILI
uniref:Uncharacterized protein n=1 Tax=Solanum lycopersicum TaxID=4081 RepID=K4D7B1_SOLLC